MELQELLKNLLDNEDIKVVVIKSSKVQSLVSDWNAEKCAEFVATLSDEDRQELWRLIKRRTREAENQVNECYDFLTTRTRLKVRWDVKERRLKELSIWTRALSVYEKIMTQN